MDYEFHDAQSGNLNKCQISNNNDIEFSDYLLDEAGVAVVPGEAFGCSNYFRTSFATSKSN